MMTGCSIAQTCIRHKLYNQLKINSYLNPLDSILHKAFSSTFASKLPLLTNKNSASYSLRHLTSTAAQIQKSKQGNNFFNENTRVTAAPSNLNIDSRSTCSPFLGISEISETKFIDSIDKKDSDPKNESSTSNEKEVDNVTNDPDEEKDLSSFLDDAIVTKPLFVVPLPERLHIPIFSLYAEGENDEFEPTRLGSIHLSPHIFGEDPIRIDILHRVVIYQRNKKRGKRFPALTKTISTKSGSGIKMRPQKGSGRARAGHKRAAHWRGGAKAHGPKGIVQDYTTKLNKKVRRMGLRHALSQKLKEGNLILVNDLRAPSVKTKELSQSLNMFGIAGKDLECGATALMLDEAIDDDESVGGVNALLKLASNNLHKVKLINQMKANVYDILKYDKLILSLAALQAIEKRLDE